MSAVAQSLKKPFSTPWSPPDEQIIHKLSHELTFIYQYHLEVNNSLSGTV